MNKQQPHILIVDDARDIREPLGHYFRKHDFRVSLAKDAEDAKEILNELTVDITILDVMMPGEDGLSLCRWIAVNHGPPVILLTALSTDSDRIVGLELGADDYVTKPFNPRELLARVRVVLRRVALPSSSVPTKQRKFNGLTHNSSTKELIVDDGEMIPLTNAENRLLSYFLDNPNEILRRVKLLDYVLGREEKAYDRAIDNHVARLRKKIEPDPSNPKLLMTEWGGGYRLNIDASDIENV